MKSRFWAAGGAVMVLSTALVIGPMAFAASYTVQAGDTLGGIATQYGVSVASLESANGITNPTDLQIGEVLSIPSGGGSAAASSGSTYTVQAGDTLGGIAAQYGVSVASLQSANGITDPTALQIGQVLTIPSGGGVQASAAAPASGTYTVQAGDTLGGIASQYGVSVTALESVNGITNPAALQIGQVLTIPGLGQTASAPQLASRGGVDRQRYTVQAGNTLSGIAAQYGVSLASLESANGITNPAALQVGTALWIPGGTAATAPAQAKPVVAAAPVASGSLGERLVATAKRFLGVPYVYGGESPSGFDCSGLVQYVARLNGISVPRTSYSQFEVGTPVAENALQPGDLVFFNTDGGVSHVGIYVGGGSFISAMTWGQPVQYASLYNSYWSARYIGARAVG